MKKLKIYMQTFLKIFADTKIFNMSLLINMWQKFVNMSSLINM